MEDVSEQSKWRALLSLDLYSREFGKTSRTDLPILCLWNIPAAFYSVFFPILVTVKMCMEFVSVEM